VKVTIYSNLITLPILVILIQILTLNGVAIYLVLVAVFPFLIMLFLYKKVFSSDYHLFKEKLSRQDIKNVFKTGVTSLLAFLFYQLVLLYLRKFIILNFGLEANGIYQSALGLSLNIFAFMYSFLGNHTLPQLSMHKDDINLSSVLDETAKFLILMIVPMILLLYSFRELIIVLFYSQSFVQAGDLILFQFSGDFFRIFASLFSLWLFSRMKIKQLIFIDLVFNALLIILPHILIKFYSQDLRIISISYMIASFVHFSLFYLYTRKILRFKFSTETFLALSISLVTLVFSMIFSTYYPNLGYYVVWIILFVWGYITIKHIIKVPVKATIEKFYKKFF